MLNSAKSDFMLVCKVFFVGSFDSNNNIKFIKVTFIFLTNVQLQFDM